MDEFAAIIKARELVRKVGVAALAAPVEAYVGSVGAVLRYDTELGADEPGWSFPSGEKH
jgi:hypothetical protein